MDMGFDHSLLQVHINHNNFPAKLWGLTNDPKNNAVFWSPNGDSLIVNQQRFEDELLSPVKRDAKIFKTTNFTSFIRQLNLYGFRKLFDGPPKDRHRNLHHFYHPFFKQGRPELLVHLKRLTIRNKAKILAGAEVTYRPPSRVYHQPQPNTTETENTGSAPPYQHISGASHLLEGFDGSLVPPHSWIFPCSDVPPFYPSRGIPVSVIRSYPYSAPRKVQSSPAALFAQETKYIPHHLSYPPGFYSPVCQGCTAGLMEADGSGGDETSLSYAAHYAYYPNYPVAHHYSNWAAHGSPESQRGDIDLDTVFQMVDEFQGLPNVHILGTHSSCPPLGTSPAGSVCPQRDERPSVIKLEPEEQELDNPRVHQLTENPSTSLESSEKVSDQKRTAEDS